MELVLYICSVNNHKHIYTMTQSQYLVMKEMVTKYEEKQKETKRKKGLECIVVRK